LVKEFTRRKGMTRMRTSVTAALVLSLALSACGGAEAAGGEVDQTGDAGLANPASVYCEEQGGTLQTRTDENGGSYGVCVFDDGSECEEWAFFRGECSPGGEAMTIDEALASNEEGPITVRGYLFVDLEGNATLASAMAESFPPQAAGSLLPAEIDLSKYSFAEEQGLRWTDEYVDVRGTLIDGVLLGVVGE
jgi:putative hemolysin